VSFHLHLRAAAFNETPPEFSSLLDFMWAAGEDHQQEYEAGIADSIENDFGHVHQLYTAGEDQGDATIATSALPIFGGRHVRSPTGDQPPFVILDPAETRGTAEFLRTISFDERWRIAGKEPGHRPTSGSVPAPSAALHRSLAGRPERRPWMVPGAPGRDRTGDISLTRRVLWPTELQGRCFEASIATDHDLDGHPRG
jgi:hypothetical protein